MPNFDFGQNLIPASKPYNPGDYGLPVWRDEDHLPPQETVTAERKSQTQTADSMTVEAAKNKLCTWVLSQVGYHEEANNWNKYANMAAVQRLYGGRIQNAPWCDLFTDAAFVTVFGLERGAAMTYQTIGNGSALCRTSADYFKEHGAFCARPEQGDVIFFYVNGDINHQGIVVRIDGGSVHTVEGNSSDMVAERVYSVSDSKIAGYGRPNWSVVADMKDKQTQESVEKDERHYYELRLPYLSKGSHGEAVRAVQFQLAAQGYYIGPDGADGDYGGNTEYAVKEFQRNVGLSADGTVGTDTGARLFGATVGEAPKVEKKEAEVKPDTFWNNLLAKIKK